MSGAMPTVAANAVVAGIGRALEVIRARTLDELLEDVTTLERVVIDLAALASDPVHDAGIEVARVAVNRMLAQQRAVKSPISNAAMQQALILARDTLARRVQRRAAVTPDLVAVWLHEARYVAANGSVEDYLATRIAMRMSQTEAV